MRKIEAIVRNLKLFEVQETLIASGVSAFSSYEIKIAGLHKGHSTTSGKPGTSKASDFIPRTKIEILCEDKDVERIVDVIKNSAKTGETGDGIILVHSIDEVVKIKTGQKDTLALH